MGLLIVVGMVVWIVMMATGKPVTARIFDDAGRQVGEVELGKRRAL